MPRLCPIESGLLSGIAGSNAADLLFFDAWFRR